MKLCRPFSRKMLLPIVTVALFSLHSCGGPPELNQEPESIQSQQDSTSNLIIENGMSLSEMNAVIAAASPGETVYVEAGTYTITGKINMNPGITLRALTNTRPIFDATEHEDELLIMQYGTEISGCKIIKIEYRNIQLKIKGSGVNNVIINSCIFDHGKRKPGTDKKYYSDSYIHLKDVQSPTIKYCKFYRRAGGDGRAITNLYTSNAVIRDNTIGDGGSKGYFVTAINERGRGTLIQNNKIRKNAAWNISAYQDHGIYAVDFDGVTITGNTISGWAATAYGGAIKARNGRNMTISNNTLNTSGILLYTYATATIQRYLRNVVIEDNYITISGRMDENRPKIYYGIGYYANASYYRGCFSIRIRNNTLNNGYVVLKSNRIVPSDFNANGGGLYYNSANRYYLKYGIDVYGNYGPITWY